MMAAAYGDKIYTFFQKRTYEYNPANDTWIEKAPIPTTKAHGSAELIDNKIYLVAASGDSLLHIYDPARNIWTSGAKIPGLPYFAE